MDTALLKFTHIACVALSYALFVLRGIWMLRDRPSLHARWMKFAPHTVDTVLLASAVTLAWQLGLSPLSTPWLAAKIAALLLYIALGTVALRYGRIRHIRLSAWLMAQMVFFYMVSAAVTHDPAPWKYL